jgi:hypothetical protein
MLKLAIHQFVRRGTKNAEENTTHPLQSRRTRWGR